jgi:hypothetical protein
LWFWQLIIPLARQEKRDKNKTKAENPGKITHHGKRLKGAASAQLLIKKSGLKN